jgi:ribosomal protein L12E/L44/L45/RPP1/RPP2
VIVIETAAAREATHEILRLHSIPAMVSKDLQDLLNDGDFPPVAPPGDGQAAATAAVAEEAAPEPAPVK